MELNNGAFISAAKFVSMNIQRKRPIHVNDWRDVKAKTLRNSGQPYQSRDGTHLDGKHLPSNDKVCGGRCDLDGCKVDGETKSTLFTKYYEMANLELQHTYLASNMQRFQQGNRNRCRYFLPVGGERFECCQKTFLNVYRVTARVIDTLNRKMLGGDICIRDGRGKHHNRSRKNSQELKQEMLEHIQSYPTYETHYARESHGPVYLSSELSVTKMFQQFCAERPANPEYLKKMGLYSNIFRKTGLKIGQPKSDTCKTCDLIRVKLSTARIDDKAPIEAEQQLHHSRAEAAYAALREDAQRSRDNPAYVTICVDMEQTLFSPKLTHGEMFYLRQFASINYCIYYAATETANMIFWNETDAHRGVDEVASVIIKSLLDKFRQLEPGQERTLVCWSDRCKGQTNNWPFVCSLLYLVSRNIFTRVEQKFLVSGHSFLPCDRLFGLIELRKQDCKVIIPDEWCDVILSAQPSKPFQVTRVVQENIWNVKQAFDAIKKPQNLKVTEMAWLRFDCHSPEEICIRSNHTENAEWISHAFSAPYQVGVRHARRIRFSVAAMNDIRLERKYFVPIPLSHEKLSDIRKMIPYLEGEGKAFFLNLVAENDEDGDRDAIFDEV